MDFRQERHQIFAKNQFEHIRAGQEAGIFWTPPVTITDRMEAAARERTRRRIEQLKGKQN